MLRNKEEVGIRYELNIELSAIIAMMTVEARFGKHSRVRLCQHIVRFICIARVEINP